MAFTAMHIEENAQRH